VYLIKQLYILTFILFLSSCTNDTDVQEDYSLREYPVVIEEPENINTDRVLTAFVVHGAAPIFQKAADSIPDLYLDITIYDWEFFDALGAERARLMTMAGQPFDIMHLMEGYMPYWNYSLSGFFTDLNGLIDRELFYTNVLEAWEINGNLYGIPILFGFEYIGVSSNLPASFTERFASYDSISPYGLINFYLDLKQAYGAEFSHWDMGTTSLLFHPVNIVSSAMAYFVDINNRTANLNNEDFVNILNISRNIPPLTPPDRWTISGLPARGWRAGMGYIIHRREFLSEESLRSIFISDRYFLSPANALLTPTTAPYFIHHIPVADCYGRLKHSNTLGLVCVSISADQDLAAEFLHALIDATSNYTNNRSIGFYLTGLQVATPIKREYFPAHTKSVLSPAMGESGSVAYGGQSFNARYTDLEGVIARLERYNNMPVSPNHFLPPDLYESLLQEFFLGQRIAEETAELINQRVTLWFMEIS